MAWLSRWACGLFTEQAGKVGSRLMGSLPQLMPTGAGFLSLPEQVDGEEVARHQRRMALRVERDAAAEEAAREGKFAPLQLQPGYLEGVGSLKDYQLEGECLFPFEYLSFEGELGFCVRAEALPKERFSPFTGNMFLVGPGALFSTGATGVIRWLSSTGLYPAHAVGAHTSACVPGSQEVQSCPAGCRGWWCCRHQLDAGQAALLHLRHPG